jgi:DNA-binding MarR family transcriptional regulator
MDPDFSDCFVLNARMAARAVSRRYDRWARKFGVTAAQFSILAAVARSEGASVTEIAHRTVMDRTTMSRNLDLLEKKGMVESRGAENGNSRICGLTAKGRALFDRLVPRWREAQAQLRRDLADVDLDQTLLGLKRLAEA